MVALKLGVVAGEAVEEGVLEGRGEAEEEPEALVVEVFVGAAV